MMKNRKKLVIIVSTIAAFFVLMIALFWNGHDNDKTLTLYGNIDIRQTDVGFRVFGKLQKMYFEEGDQVSEGQLLAELDNLPYSFSYREVEARVNSLTNSLSYANNQLERRGSLVHDGSVSQEEYQAAYYNQKTLEANLQEAKAALERSKINLADTALTAPSSGVIYTRIREPGTVLNIGQPVYSIAVDNPVWARTYVSEPQLGKVYPGMPADVYTDTPGNPVYRGHIGFISPIAEFTPKNVETSDLRTSLVYQLRVIVDNPDRGLRQGMPVTVKLNLETAVENDL